MNKGNRVQPAEIQELLKLKGWSQVELSRRLDMSESTVCLWLSGRRHPIGAASTLMNMWLAGARQDAKKPKRLQTAPA
jgi:DNA-binding transcriptional regulator YiaG